jgi:hypothetical protein
VQHEAHEVGHDGDEVARQPIREDAADEQEGDQRQAVRGQDEAEVGRAARQVDDEQRERDRDDAIADDARRVGEPQQAKVAVAQDAQELLGAVISRKRGDARG